MFSIMWTFQILIIIPYISFDLKIFETNWMWTRFQRLVLEEQRNTSLMGFHNLWRYIYMFFNYKKFDFKVEWKEELRNTRFWRFYDGDLYLPRRGSVKSGFSMKGLLLPLRAIKIITCRYHFIHQLITTINSWFIWSNVFIRIINHKFITFFIFNYVWCHLN